MTTLNPAVALSGDTRETWLEFRDHLEGCNRSPRTVDVYGAAISQLQVWLDDHEPGRAALDAGQREISRYLAWCVKVNSGSTAANRHRSLRQFFKFAAAESIITADPMDRLPCPSFEYRIPEIVPDDQLTRLLASAEKDKSFYGLRDAAIIRVLCEPGSPRASELTGMMLDDFNMESKTVIIRRGKGGKMRVIGMSPSTSKAVFRYRRARAARPGAQDMTDMWLGRNGALGQDGLGKMLARRCRDAGVPHMHPHQLRHTAFADFDDQNGNVNYEMSLFGWSSPAMAHHYGKSARARNAILAAQQMRRGDRFGKR